MEKFRERYILISKKEFSFEVDRIPFKTLREAEMYYNILTPSEKEDSYIYDVVKHEKVELKGK